MRGALGIVAGFAALLLGAGFGGTFRTGPEQATAFGVRPWGEVHLFPEDANTQCHAWFDGTQIRDSRCAWSMGGTVPQVAPSTLWIPPRAGAGVFSDANFYYLPGSPAGSDVLDTCSTWTRALAFRVSTTTGTRVVYNNRTSAPNNGDHVVVSGSTANPFFNGTQLTTSGTIVAGHVHVLIWGHDGTKAWGVLDANAVASATQAWTGATGQQARLGKHNSDGFSASDGTVFEFYSTCTTPTATTLPALAAAARARLAP